MVGEKSRAQQQQYEVGIDEEGVMYLSVWRYRLHLNEHCSEQAHRKQQGSYWMVLEQVLALAPGREPEPELLLGVGLEPELLVLELLPELGLVPGFVLELELEPWRPINTPSYNYKPQVIGTFELDNGPGGAGVQINDQLVLQVDTT